MRGLLVEHGGLVERRARPWIVTAASAIGWATFTLVIMHIVSGRDPITDTLSSYAYTAQGAGLLEAGVFALAFGSIALLGALSAADLQPQGTPSVLLVLWAGGLSVAAMFPASFTAHPAPVSGEIHQWACVTAFLSLPGFGFSLAERMRTKPGLATSRAAVLKLSWLATAALLIFGLSYMLPDPRAGASLSGFSEMLPVGLTQRIALAADLVLLCGALMVVLRATRLTTGRKLY